MTLIENVVCIWILLNFAGLAALVAFAENKSEQAEDRNFDEASSVSARR